MDNNFSFDQFCSVLCDSRMSVSAGEWSYQEYLSDRLTSGISIQRNEKANLEYIEKYVGGKINRNDAQQLKIKLAATRGIKQLLGSKSQQENLLKIWTFKRKLNFSEKIEKQKTGVCNCIRTTIPSRPAGQGLVVTNGC